MTTPSSVPIPFPVTSRPSARTQETGGRLINAFAEPLADTAQGDRVWRRVPGLKAWGTTTRTGFRGAIEVEGVLYTAWSEQLEKHTSGSGGASTNVGALTGTKRGFFARNNKTPTPDKVFVDPDGNIAVFTATSVTNGYPDVDLPSVTSVTSIDGYFVFGAGDGRMFASDLNSTAVNALSFGKAEFKPDGIIRVITMAEQLVVMGNYTTEIWRDVGATPFPFQRATVIQRGLAGPYAVAGHQDYFTKELIWVADDNTVVRLIGYQAEKISPPDLDRLIEAVTDKTTLEATAYMTGGHPLWELSCASWTWVYDINTGQWHERAKYLGSRSRIKGAVYYSAKWLTGDTDSGNVVEINSATYKDITSPLVARIESGPVQSFPNYRRLARADFNFAVGVGVATGADPIETDPTVEISCSLDGGVTWSIPRQCKLGQQAKGKTRVTVHNMGISGPYGPRFRLDISDPIYVGLLGGTISDEVRVG